MYTSKSQNNNPKNSKNRSSEIMQHVHFQKSSVTKTAVMWQFHNKNWLFPLSSKYIQLAKRDIEFEVARFGLSNEEYLLWDKD